MIECLSSFVTVLANKINDIFAREVSIPPDIQSAQIHHLGGVKVTSSDFFGNQVKLDAPYFYERVPIRIDVKNDRDELKRSEVFLYGKTLEKYAEEWRATPQDKGSFSDFAARRIAEDQIEIENVKVRYFSEEDREKTEIVIENGNLAQIGLDQERDKKEMSGTYAFALGTILDLDGRMKKILLATPKVPTLQGKIQHSSFFRGGNVLSAGMLEVTQNGGNLTIRNQSGHYKPTEKELAHVIKHLEEIGYDISKIHVTCTTFRFLHFFKDKFNLNVNWLIVPVRADKWLKDVGCHLIKDDLSQISEFNQKISPSH